MKNMIILPLFILLIVSGVFNYIQYGDIQLEKQACQSTKDSLLNILNQFESELIVVPLKEKVSIGDSLSAFVAPVLRRKRDTLFSTGARYFDAIPTLSGVKNGYSICKFPTSHLDDQKDTILNGRIVFEGSIMAIGGENVEISKNFDLIISSGYVTMVDNPD